MTGVSDRCTVGSGKKGYSHFISEADRTDHTTNRVERVYPFLHPLSYQDTLTGQFIVVKMQLLKTT